MQIPKPQDWEEFEAIARASLRLKWKSPNLTGHGRQGQAQNGVDIFGPDDLGRNVGVQCKRTDELTRAVIDEEIGNAERFEPELMAFYFATTADSDVHTQQVVRRISEARVGRDQFPVGVFFWQDLIEELVKNPEEFRLHFPQLALPAPGGAAAGSRLLAALDLAYYGANLTLNMALLFGEAGQMANEDPMQLRSLLLTIENCAGVLMDPGNSTRITADGQALEGYVLPFVLGQEQRAEGWEPAQRLVRSIQDRINAYDVRLQGRELNLFSIGRILARLSEVMIGAEEIPNDFRQRLHELVTQLDFDPGLAGRLADVYRDYEGDAGVRIVRAPHRLFHVVRRSVINLQVEAD
jgi:hypothetical protein